MSIAVTSNIQTNIISWNEILLGHKSFQPKSHLPFLSCSNIEKLYLSDWKLRRKYIMWMWMMCLEKGRSKYPCTSNHLSSFAKVADSRSFLFARNILIIKRFIE